MLPLTMFCLVVNLMGTLFCGALALDNKPHKKLAQLALASLFVGFIMWPVYGLMLLFGAAFGDDDG